MLSMKSLAIFALASWLNFSDGAAFVGQGGPARSCTCIRLAANNIANRDGETTDRSPLSRRRTLQWGGIMLSSWLLPKSSRPSHATTGKQNILITGGNSGIGYEAALRLARDGHHIILPCRTIEKARDAVERLQSELSSSDALISPGECDLASLASIKSFAKTSLPSILGNELLDVVCLNAGIARNTNAKEVLRTAEGLELTVGTNHFGHFYLNSLLLPLVEPSNGRIVVTASGVHDPESPGGNQGALATLGDLQGLERDGPRFEMVDGGKFNADKAYKDSKLCNVLFARELQRRLHATSATRGIKANCFSPGLIVGSGLFRDQNKLFTKVFDVAATDLLKVGETTEWGGGALAYMTKVENEGCYYLSAPGSSKYGDAAFGNQFTVAAVSKEAQDDAKAKRLWELSEKIVDQAA